VSEALTEGSEAGALLLLLGKMLFLTHSAKGNPLGGLYIPIEASMLLSEMGFLAVIITPTTEQKSIRKSSSTHHPVDRSAVMYKASKADSALALASLTSKMLSCLRGSCPSMNFNAVDAHTNSPDASLVRV